jgi:nucleoside permease NupC
VPWDEAAEAGSYIGLKTDVASVGLKALLAGSMVNLANAAIAGLVVG